MQTMPVFVVDQLTEATLVHVTPQRIFHRLTTTMLIKVNPFIRSPIPLILLAGRVFLMEAEVEIITMPAAAADQTYQLVVMVAKVTDAR